MKQFELVLRFRASNAEEALQIKYALEKLFAMNEYNLASVGIPIRFENDKGGDNQ